MLEDYLHVIHLSPIMLSILLVLPVLLPILMMCLYLLFSKEKCCISPFPNFFNFIRHEQTFLRRHTEEISALTVSEHLIVTGQYGEKGSREARAPVCVWQFADNKLIYELGGHLVSITALAISQDERFLATGGGDCMMIIWDLKSGKQVASFKSDRLISCRMLLYSF